MVKGGSALVADIEVDAVRQEVLRLEREVLDDQVQLRVGVFDPRDRDVSDLLDELGQDGLDNVGPEVGLERQVALRVEQHVLDELLDVLAEADIERVLCQASVSSRHRSKGDGRTSA